MREILSEFCGPAWGEIDWNESVQGFDIGTVYTTDECSTLGVFAYNKDDNTTFDHQTGNLRYGNHLVAMMEAYLIKNSPNKAKECGLWK